MERWDWARAGGSAAAAVAVIFGGDWFAGQVMNVSYPEHASYEVPGVAPVDLAALQRSWPAGLDSPGAPSELRGYIGAIDKAVPPPPPAGAIVPAVAAPVDLGTLLASADSARGKGAAQVCGSCHTFDPGGANRVGPNLWGVVGRPVGKHQGFAYSPAFASHGGAWDYETLDRYLASPAKAIPGNKMAFAGIRNPKDRANVIAWLGSLNSKPVPFPAPKPTEGGGGGGGGTTAR